jgi:two-component system, chemotaxis family, CheB/CheR fusion protein
MVLEGRSVLVVEDVADIREVFVALLRTEGADVVATDSGREAVELVRDGRFDIVLSDLGLPDIPGDVLIGEIVATSGGRTRVFAVTGYDEPFRTRARLAGAEAVFSKPVEWSDILRCMSRSAVPAAA